MSFEKKQIDALNAPLDARHIRSRSQAGQQLSYVEGWHVIAEANRIFGHEGWDRHTELSPLGEPEQVNDKWRVRFMATVTITVRAGDDAVSRQGVGYGSGIAKDQGDAFEGAIKEAETDAMKRALMTFGWPFGLALYDKSRENVMDGSKARYLEQCKATIAESADADTLKTWWNSDQQKKARRDFDLTKPELDELKQLVMGRVSELEKEAA